MAYEYDPRRRRRGRVPPQLRAWVFGRRRRAPRRRFYIGGRRRGIAMYYDPRRRSWRRPGIWGLLSKAVGVGVFVEQVTEKDRKASGATFTGYSLANKMKFIIQSITSRVIGFHPFKDMPAWDRVLNPMGIFNKWLGVGIGLIIAGMIPGIPYRGRMKSFGRMIAIGGALGGLFDQPALQTSAYNPELNRKLVGSPLITQRQPGSVWA